MGIIISLIRQFFFSKGDDSQEQDNSGVHVRLWDMVKSTAGVFCRTPNDSDVR